MNNDLRRCQHITLALIARSHILLFVGLNNAYARRQRVFRFVHPWTQKKNENKRKMISFRLSFNLQENKRRKRKKKHYVFFCNEKQKKQQNFLHYFSFFFLLTFLAFIYVYIFFRSLKSYLCAVLNKRWHGMLLKITQEFCHDVQWSDNL